MGDESQQRANSRLRWALVACQAISILITWNVWQVRDATHPLPNLPLIQSVPQFPMGLILLFSLAMVLARPVAGLAAHAAILALSIVQDETRLQPEFLSLVLLLVGTLPGRFSRDVARAHLGSLWLWAGLHKLLSDGYWTWQGELFVTVYWPEAPGVVTVLGSAVVAISELLLGVAAFAPSAKRFVPLGATLVHGAALLWLACQSWNYAVWPWQIGLILAAWVLFSESAEQHQQMADGTAVDRHSSTRRGIALVMLAYPMLYYVNLLPPPVAWCVYSGNVPVAMLFEPVTVSEDGLPKIPQGTWLFEAGFRDLNVPYPTMPSSCQRFLAWYGKEGASISIDDPRPLSRWRGKRRLGLVKTAVGVVIVTEPMSIITTTE